MSWNGVGVEAFTVYDEALWWWDLIFRCSQIFFLDMGLGFFFFVVLELLRHLNGAGLFEGLDFVERKRNEVIDTYYVVDI